MKTFFCVILTVLIAASAIRILIARLAAFLDTKGASGCKNCPYHSDCSGSCRG